MDDIFRNYARPTVPIFYAKCVTRGQQSRNSILYALTAVVMHRIRKVM